MPENELYFSLNTCTAITLRSSQCISLHATISINKQHHLRIQIESLHHSKNPLMFPPGNLHFKSVDYSENKNGELQRHVSDLIEQTHKHQKPW